MRIILLMALLLSGPAATYGQTTTVPLNFCGVPIPVAAGCTSETGYGLRCDKYELKWAYLNYQQMGPVADEAVKAEMRERKQAEKTPLEGFLLDMPAKGYRLSYLTDAGMAYQLILYGVAKGQPVLVQLTLDLDPEKTTDLPEPARLIIRLMK
ncbi:MAG: hypothetical protein H7Z21_10390 [Hymenobacter sp.]|nr:hypothetical protein [Hymenobacter sp.]